MADQRSSYADAFAYPGEFLDHSYMTDGSLVLTVRPGELQNESGGTSEFEVVDLETGEFIDVNDYLEELGVPGMEERYPVIAYGANTNAVSLLLKFNYGEDGDNSLLIAPVIRAKRGGSQIAWTKRLGIRGRQIADMITNEDVEDVEIDIFVTFLTHDQVAIMNSSERNYDMVEQGEVTLEGGQIIPGFYYSVTKSEAYSIDGKPAIVDAVTTKNIFGESHTAKSALQSILDKMHQAGGADLSADAFIKQYESMDEDGDERINARCKIEQFLEDKDLVYTHERPRDTLVHEWSFNSLPTYGQIINGYGDTGVQGRLFTNDLIADAGKRALVESMLNR